MVDTTHKIIKLINYGLLFSTQFTIKIQNIGLFTRFSSGWWLTYPSEKYEFVNGKDDIPYMKWNIKFMFETTNQP